MEAELFPIRDGKTYYPTVPGIDPETGERVCGICGAPGEEDCIEDKHWVDIYYPKSSEPYVDTKFDLFLERHPKIDHFYVYNWLSIELRIKRFFRFRQNWKDWRFRRQFKPGGYFLDHGTDPAVITTVSSDAVRGVSLVTGQSVVSDLHACGPIPTNEKAAWVATSRLREERNKLKTEERELLAREIGWPPNGGGMRNIADLVERMIEKR